MKQWHKAKIQQFQDRFNLTDYQLLWITFAKGVLIGRAYAYGLAAAGGPGVARAIEILKSDIIRTMKLLGCDSVAKLDRSFVTIPDHWEPR